MGRLVAAWALGLTYRGSQFHGWQRQPNCQTVQGALEQALSKMADQPIRSTVAGRTDKGVHACGQVVGFASNVDREASVWLRGLNGLTPEALQINWVTPVSDTFHPRYSATARTYQYLYADAAATHSGLAPFLRELAWCCPALDVDAMHRAAQGLLGEHDFSSFRGAGCQSMTPVRRVDRIEVARHQGWVVMTIEANAFLLHMVRNIARALHDVGVGHQPADLVDLLQARDRTRLGATAPPDGLYLTRVSYPGFALPEPAQPWFAANRVQPVLSSPSPSR